MFLGDFGRPSEAKLRADEEFFHVVAVRAMFLRAILWGDAGLDSEQSHAIVMDGEANFSLSVALS